MIFAELSFRQISEVVRSDRVSLCATAKVGTVSSKEASCMSRISCAIGIQALSEIMKKTWAFAIGADESNKYELDAHLDIPIRFFSVAGFAGGPDIERCFHLIAILLNALAHSDKTYAGLLINVSDTICEDWRIKLIGSSTDGIGNMTLHNAGLSTFLRHRSEYKDSFCRL